MVIARGMKESFTLVRRLCYQIYPLGKARLDASPAFVAASMLWFMSRIRSFYKLLSTGLHECRAWVDILLRTAAQAGSGIFTARIEAMKPSEH